MNRTFPISDINSPTLRLKSAIEVVQDRYADGKFRAYTADDTIGIEGSGETWSIALQDFMDNLVSAAEGNSVPALVALVEPRPEPGVVIAPSVAHSVAQAPAGEVYVIIESESDNSYFAVLGVTRDLRYARRWAKWNPRGSYKKFTLDVLPEDEDAE